jgi:dTDP-4-amino-4,6-dideoxygalactose transaminase
VIIAAYDYPGNFRTIELLGATPVLVDVAADSPCMDATQLAAVASPRVVAVIASHLYGQAAPIEAIRSRCQDHGWLLIEDACQVPGMRIGQRPAGSFGDLAALSFGGSKPITCGTGGALLISNELLAARLTAIVDRPSDTYPLSPLQAATIGPQLDRLSEMNRIRAATARFLIDARPDLQWIDGNDPHVTPAYYKLAWQSTLPHAHPSLPIGSGFRAAAQISPRRCRKPVPLDRSLELAHRCRLLDHRALLIDAADHQKLADALPR